MTDSSGSRDVAGPLSILFAVDSMRVPLPGVGRLALTILRDLVALGHRVTPLDYQPNPLAEEIAGSPCRVVSPRFGLARTALWHFDLLHRIRGLQGEFQFFLNPTGYPNVLGSHPHLLNWVCDLHMLQPGFYRRGKYTWFRAFLGRSLRKAQRLICISNYTREQLLAAYTLPANKVVVVPASLDPGMQVDPAELPPPCVRSPFFLTVGLIGERKNSHRLLAAYAQARREGIQPQLIFAGQLGNDGEQVQARIIELGLQENVRIISGLDDRELQSLYRHARALLFPSLDEGFGLPILEAMAVDTPVLTGNVSAMPEVAGDGALLVDPFDCGDIAAGIGRIEKDEALREKLRLAGRERVRLYQSRRQAEILQNCLWELATSKK